MPNIPPLAQEVIKSQYFAAFILFVLYTTLILTLPQNIKIAINAAVAGWFVGVEIYKLSLKWEQHHNEL